MPLKYKFNSLEDYLISTILTVDAQLDDGWGAMFPVKGKELEATILFADIYSFSARTLDLTPTETLIFVNHFFAWISAEALRDANCIVDKYIGDEIMIIFAKEFGSEDPFVEAVRAAIWINERDVLAFNPHIGIASGLVTIGYVGTPIKYNCSAFGAPVALAARCAGADSERSIVFPASEWQNRDFSTIFPPTEYTLPNGSTEQRLLTWKLLPPRIAHMKNIGDVEIQEISNQQSVWLSTDLVTAEERAKEYLKVIREEGRYWQSP